MSSWSNNIFHQAFLKQLDTEKNDIIIMQESQEGAAEVTIQLDIRMHDSGAEKSYLVGLINPYGIAHPETGVTVMEAGPFKHYLNLDEATPQYDEHYLGPFDREQTLMIMGAAEHMAVKYGIDERIAALTELSHMHNVLTNAHSEKFNMLCAADRDAKREALKSQFRVLPGGKRDGPGPS